jgi:hypothetical protein
MTYWKILNGTESVTVADYRYPGKGRWTTHLNPADLQACEVGFHVCRDEQTLNWLNGPTLWRVEICPDHDPIVLSDKIVTCRVRLIERHDLDDRRLRLFAADCAEQALVREREAGREPDERSWAAVQVARDYADGMIWAAARDAAWDAAWAAAWDAAGDAAGEAAWAAAGDAAWAAARAAAGEAARAAARAAAWAAAGDAARAAAWAAARAAQWRMFCDRFGIETP